MPEVRGISTYDTYLMYKTNTAASYAKVIDITNFPDMIGAPEEIDITTLSDGQRVKIPGISDRESMVFNANYTKANFKTIKALENNQYYYALYFGSTGAEGILEWTGDVRAGLTGGGVNEAVGMTVTCTPSTEVTFRDPAA